MEEIREGSQRVQSLNTIHLDERIDECSFIHSDFFLTYSTNTSNGVIKQSITEGIEVFIEINILCSQLSFYQIDESKPIIMEVPVQMEGLAEGVKAGGKLALQIRKLKDKALYNVIPERLVINVSHLGLGKTIKVGELHYEGLELMNAKEAVVCAVKLTRAARGAAAAAASNN